jgi:hypothetical protein
MATPVGATASKVRIARYSPGTIVVIIKKLPTSREAAAGSEASQSLMREAQHDTGAEAKGILHII